METKGEKTQGEDRPQFHHKHPPDVERDLNPEFMAGQNMGPLSSEGERGVHTAYDVKEVHYVLSDLRDDELKQIPIVPTGQRLRQGAKYYDLGARQPQEFTAMGGMRAERGNYFIPKDEVPYMLWNRLTGEEKPGQEHEGDKERME
jgi:hypothetical protein